MTREEAIERIGELEREIEDVRAHNERLAEQQAKLSGRLADAEEALENATDTIESLEKRLDATARQRNRLARRMARVEDVADIDAEEATAAADSLTPLGLLIRAGPAAVWGGEPSPTQRRAAALADHWQEWGESTADATYGEHHALVVGRDDLVDRLERATGESLAHIQTYRAMETLADLGAENVRVVDDYHGRGKALVMEAGD
jgi:thioesterase domain-containing protein